MRISSALRAFPSLFLLHAFASAQSTTLVVTGTPVAGVGTVVEIVDVSVGDSGDWLVLARTDHPIAAADEVLFKNGAVYLREGDPIAGASSTFAPQGLFGWPRVDGVGHVWWTQSDGLYRDGVAILRSGDPIVATGFSASAVYASFQNYAVNDAGRIVLSAVVYDPLIVGLTDAALLRFTVDAAGVPSPPEVLLIEGGALFGLPLQSDPLVPVTGAIALNESGEVAFQAENFSITGVLRESAVVAEEEQPSALFAKTWWELFAAVDLGDGGDLAFAGLAIDHVTAAEPVVVWNGMVVASDGDVLPVLAPHAIESFAIGSLETRNVFVDALGRVLWFADWDDPDSTRDTGILLDHDLIVQEGVSVAAGRRIDEIGGRTVADGGGQPYELSDDGRLFVYEALLDDGREGAFLLDLEFPASPVPHAGCLTNAASLDIPFQLHLGTTMTVLMTNPQSPSVAAAYVGFSLQSVVGASGCGIAFPGAGELLIGMPVHQLSLVTSLLPVTGSAYGSLHVPDELALLGTELYAQGLFVDPSAAAAEPLRLSNAYALKLGFP